MICGRLGQELGSVSIHVYRVQKLFFQDRRVSQLQYLKEAFYIYVYMSHSIRGLIGYLQEVTVTAMVSS
jgi:hypothetical protein